jgi:CRP-like cAMP-binding protein
MNSPNKNSLLAMLDATSELALFSHLSPITADICKVLHEQGEAADYVYFPTAGMVSLVTVMRDGHAVETGAVGFDGAVGINSALSGRRTTCRAVVQLPMTSQRIAKTHFRQAYDQSDKVRLMVHQANELLIETHCIRPKSDWQGGCCGVRTIPGASRSSLRKSLSRKCSGCAALR